MVARYDELRTGQSGKKLPGRLEFLFSRPLREIAGND